MAKPCRPYTISIDLGLKNEEREDNLPWAYAQSSATLAVFFEENGIGPGELLILRQSLNNGGLHLYALLWSDKTNVSEFYKPKSLLMLSH